MNKKGLFLLAAAIIAVDCTSQLQVYAKPVESSGAIIRQLMPVDNEQEIRQIIERDEDEQFTPFDKDIEIYFSREQNNQFEQADIDFERLLSSFDNMSDKKLKEKNFQKLNWSISVFSDSEPYNARIFYKKYLLESKLGSYTEALKALKKAYNLDKNNPVYLFEIAKMHLNENDYNSAIKIIETLKRNYPRELKYRLALGQVYSQAGKYEDAIREYRVSVAFDPDNDEAIVALNELIPYTLMQQQGGQPFYDPMKVDKKETVQVETQPVNKVVAFSTVQQTSQPQKTYVKQTIEKKENSNNTLVNTSSTKKLVTQQSENTLVDSSSNINQRQQEAVSNTKSLSQRNKIADKKIKNVPKAAPGSKRVVVTYVNGRKVVKIVNINSDANSSSTLQDASSTFSNQLDDMNSGYDTSNTSNQTLNTTTLQSSPDMSQSKYHTNTGYYVNSSSSANDDISINSIANNTSGRKQLVVTYDNGKKVVKTIGADGSYVSETKQVEKNKKEQEKLIKKELKEKEKLVAKERKDAQKQAKNNQTINQASSATQTASAQTTDGSVYKRAEELMANGNYQEAINVLNQVNPPSLRSITTMAACYNSLGQTSTAIDYYKKADKMSPNNAQILYALAYLYYTQNNVEQAKKYVDVSLKISPDNPNAQQLKQYMAQNASNINIDSAVAFMNQGNYSAAKKILEKVVTEQPNDFQAFYYLGHICYATQKYEDASKNFLNAIKLNPKYALSYYSIGLAYDKLKEFNKSIVAYQQFLQMETDDNKYTQYAQTRVNTIKSKQ